MVVACPDLEFTVTNQNLCLDCGGGGIVAKSCLTLLRPCVVSMCMRVKSLSLCLTLCDPRDLGTATCPGLLCPWSSPGKDTGVDCHALLQGIFLTQRLNPHLLHLLH